MAVRDFFGHMIQKQGEDEVISAKDFHQWLCDMKIINSEATNTENLVEAFAWDKLNPTHLSMELIHSALNHMEHSDYARSFLCCKMTDNTALSTERNFMRQNLRE